MPPDRSRQYRPVTINLTDKLHADIQAIADRQLGTVSQVVRQACQEVVERHKREEARDDAR